MGGSRGEDDGKGGGDKSDGGEGGMGAGSVGGVDIAFVEIQGWRRAGGVQNASLSVVRVEGVRQTLKRGRMLCRIDVR